MRGPTRTILAACLAVGSLTWAIPAAAEHRPGPCALEREEDEGPRFWSIRLIQCATDEWTVPGGAERAICIAEAESGLDPKAKSPRGEYLGLFQHAADAWPDRYLEWTKRRWQLDDRPLNARTNTIVTIRLVNADGWGPWRHAGDC
ncbi:MAG TPA: hypothetical protein VLA90_11755 [Actinomycetota bacterium]|nr:hypothetical protein [Actinomycetota bacterium]